MCLVKQSAYETEIKMQTGMGEELIRTRKTCNKASNCIISILKLLSEKIVFRNSNIIQYIVMKLQSTWFI